MTEHRLTDVATKADVVMERRKFDVGIVVPLKEEFRYVVDISIESSVESYVPRSPFIRLGPRLTRKSRNRVPPASSN